MLLERYLNNKRQLAWEMQPETRIIWSGGTSAGRRDVQSPLATLRFGVSASPNQVLPIVSSDTRKESSVDRRFTNLTSTLMLLSQLLIVVVLAVLVFTIAYVSWQARDTAHYYYPLMVEGANNTMEILRHGHVASSSLETVMAQSEVMAVTSVPEMIQSVNRTSAMVARMQQMAQNPVIKLSME